MPPKTTHRPVIGINMDYLPAGKTGGAQMRLHGGYVEAIYASGGLPLIIPPVLKERELTTVMAQLDGFLMIGGPLDMDPRRLGMNPHPNVQPMPAKREDFDRMVGRMVIDQKMPLLAVGLGMLELNALCGGTMFLHLPEDMPKALPHKDLTGGVHRHLVNLEPKTRLDQIYGGGEIRVNSYHHQAVNEPPRGFRVSARSLDGVIEAIEAEDRDWFCIGVQWHPHSETASALDMQLFEEFLKAAAKRDMILPMKAAA